MLTWAVLSGLKVVLFSVAGRGVDRVAVALDVRHVHVVDHVHAGPGKKSMLGNFLCPQVGHTWMSGEPMLDCGCGRNVRRSLQLFCSDHTNVMLIFKVY